MHFKKALSVLSFVGALVIGLAAGWIADNGVEVQAVVAPVYISPIPIAESVPVRAEDLLGRWKGTWGYERELCTIEILRVNGNRFSGKLHKDGAEIAFAGRLDPVERKLFFKETKILKLGAYEGWSLGTNTGSFSPDGGVLTGIGTDEWGTYGWDAAKD